MGASRSLGSFPPHSAQWCHCIVRGRWWSVVNFSDTQSSKLGRPSRVPAKLDRLDQKPIWKTRDRLFPLVVCSYLWWFFSSRDLRASAAASTSSSLATARGGQQGAYLLLTPTRPGARTSLQSSHPKLLKQGAVGVEAARVLQDLYKFWRLGTCKASGWMVDWFRRGTSYLGVRIRGLSTRLFQQTTLEEWFMWQCVCVSAKLGLCAGTSTIPQVFGFACTGLQLSLACSLFTVWYHSFVACFPSCFIATLPDYVGIAPFQDPT